MRFLFASLFTVLLGFETANAFINIEALRRNPEEGATGSLNLQGSGSSGNTNKAVGQFSTLNMFRQEGQEFFFLGNLKYGESNYLRDTFQGSVHLRYSQEWDSFPITEFFLQNQFDEFKLLKARYLIGSGLRFKLRENPKGNSFLGVGFFREKELIDLPNENQEDWRGNFYLSQLVDLSENWQGSLILYFQPAFDESADYRIRADLGLESAITEILSLNITYSHQYDSRPPSTVKEQDISYLFGLSLKF